MTSPPLDWSRRPVFLPVIHPVHLVDALRSVDVAVEAQADGVMLINQGMCTAGVLDVHDEILRQHPGLWTGINLLGEDTRVVLDTAAKRGFDAVWFDGLPHVRLDSAAFVVMGGAAFKGQGTVHESAWGSAAVNALRYADVVVTSGIQTGVAAPVRKLQAMRAAIGERPLGLASGVTVENVEGYLPHVDVFLVATGIEEEFGILSAKKTRKMADKIRGFARDRRWAGLPIR